MSFMNDLKKLAITRLKERRHRQTVMFLDSLPNDLKKDIGWTGPNRRYDSGHDPEKWKPVFGKDHGQAKR